MTGSDRVGAVFEYIVEPVIQTTMPEVTGVVMVD